MFCLLSTVLGIISVTFAHNSSALKSGVILTKEEDRMIEGMTRACSEYTEAGTKIIKRFFKYKSEPDVETKDFLYCLFVGLNVSTLEGHLNQKFLSFFNSHPFQKDVKYVYDSCKSEDKFRYIDTLYEEISCFFMNSPVTLGESGKK